MEFIEFISYLLKYSFQWQNSLLTLRNWKKLRKASYRSIVLFAQYGAAFGFVSSFRFSIISSLKVLNKKCHQEKNSVLIFFLCWELRTGEAKVFFSSVLIMFVIETKYYIKEFNNIRKVCEPLPETPHITYYKTWKKIILNA